jgi:16S rRNA (guanine966-N2)-methyltransferase
VTRIIAGFAGSLAIATPGRGTRPTSDRVREAIFSALDARGALPGARVVDLYAGSGALGLEAASRGASQVTLVERSPVATRICRKNAAVVLASVPSGHDLSIEVSGQTVQLFVNASNDIWDLALMDPPYDLPETELREVLAALVPRLAPDAIVMLERSSRSPEPAWPNGMELERRKNYGDTTLWWARPIRNP